MIAHSYLLLFIVDAIISLLAAGIVLLALPETKPQAGEHAQPESMAQTFAGYGRAFKDIPFVAFVLVCVMMTLVYMNMTTTLGVFLRDQHGIPESSYGLLISLNAILVVLFQFWLTRRLEKGKPMLMMAAGTALYALGFAAYGFVSSYSMFALAMIIITIGEMVVAPFQQSLVAGFAPEEMRGRYMAIAGLSWGLAFAAGPYLAGVIIEQVSPNWLWYACGLLGMLATIGFYILDKIHHSPAPVAAEPAATDRALKPFTPPPCLDLDTTEERFDNPSTALRQAQGGSSGQRLSAAHRLLDHRREGGDSRYLSKMGVNS